MEGGNTSHRHHFLRRGHSFMIDFCWNASMRLLAIYQRHLFIEAISKTRSIGTRNSKVLEHWNRKILNLVQILKSLVGGGGLSVE